jgi:hypothetical protein
MKRLSLKLLGLFTFLLTLPVFGYEVIEVTNGGVIKGKVKADKKYKDPMLKITKNTDYCGTSKPARLYEIAEDLGLKNVIVVIKDIKKGKAPPKKDCVIDNVDCYFEPLVQVCFKAKGNKFVFKNSDPFLHNTHINKILKSGRERTAYNLALPKKGQVIRKPIRTRGLHRVKCDAHAWMWGFVYISKHPYATVTNEKGEFEIRDIPPGRYKVWFWHPGMKEVVKEVEVKAGKVTQVSVTMTKK